MFTLSQQHQAAFQTKAETDFVREVMQYLRVNHAETIVKLPDGDFKVEDIPEETLRNMVEIGIVKALSYGLRWRDTITAFIKYMVVYSLGFFEHRCIKQLWDNSIYSIPDLKFDEIIEMDNKIDWSLIIEDCGNQTYQL